MTIHLPPFLALLGIVCGSIVASVLAFVLMSILSLMFMDTGEWGSGFWLARWPLALATLVLTGWWLSSLA